MTESRFLHIQIYNSTNTQVEYDNKTDNTWGISAGTAVLERNIMENELKFGSVIANQFEVQVFGIDVKLEKRRIIVTMDYTYDDEDTEIQLFNGIIDSSKTDNTRTYRDIIAYDRFYVDRDTDISAWWNNYWGLNPDGTTSKSVTTTLGALMSTLLTHMEFTYTKPSMINDSISLKTADMFYYSALTFGEVFSMMCVLQNVCPNIAGDGTLEFINLDTDVSYLRNNAEGLNSYWEDFTTETITGVGVYDTSTELAQLVGTNDNVYCIVANIFLLCQTASNINTICGRILSGLSNITYTPCQLKIIVSKPLNYKLGAKLYTEHGTAYILQDRLSGSLLIDEEIVSPAISATLSKDVDPISDNFRQAGKIAQIKRDIDKFTIDYADFKQDVATEFEQTANTIVLKATTGGRIVKAQLGADPSTGTSFKVQADDIAFIANGKIELTSNSLEINSTNFKVDASGNITAIGAKITGEITTTSLKIDNLASLKVEEIMHTGVNLIWNTTTKEFDATSFAISQNALRIKTSNTGLYVDGWIQNVNGSIQTPGIYAGSALICGIKFDDGKIYTTGKITTNNIISLEKYQNSQTYVNELSPTYISVENQSMYSSAYLSADGTVSSTNSSYQRVSLTGNDVVLSKSSSVAPTTPTWDGTNTSLVSALGAKVSKSGSTMTGQLQSTYQQSTSWLQCGKSPDFYVNNTGASGVLGANTKTGRVVLCTYASYDDLLYFNWYSNTTLAGSENKYDKNFTWNPSTNKLTTNISGHADSDLALSGGTVTGTLILSRTQDASGTANNKPALIVGGTDTQAHIEIDSNEIIAKSNGTTETNLYLGDSGNVYVSTLIHSGKISRFVASNLVYTTGSNGWGNSGIDFTDKNNARMGFLNVNKEANSKHFICLEAQLGSSYNALNVGLNGSTPYYHVSNAANFRSAIGAAASSSRLTKKNIQNITDEEAKKILNVNIVSFDYKSGFVNDSDKKEKYYGVIAEDVMNDLPFVVNVPKDYSEESFEESGGLEQDLLTVDYVNFVPYILKVLQMQQKEINKLKGE